MYELQRRRIENLLEECNELCCGYFDDSSRENSHNENNYSDNMDTKKSCSDDSNIEFEINSVTDISYHESDDDLLLILRNKYFFDIDYGTKWLRGPPNQRIRVNIILLLKNLVW